MKTKSSNAYIKLQIAYANEHCILPKRGIVSYSKAPGEFTRIVAFVDGKQKQYLVTATPDEIQSEITSRLGWELYHGR